ncbi:MAG: iron-sulfur cluster assembly scaffold protein [Hyphomicrobiaceae bacterium]
MTQLDAIYNTKILELAAAIPRTKRLPHPDATASAHSKLCGSTVAVDLVVDGDVIVDFGQTVKACLLGQAAASVVGREIIGSTGQEIRAVGEALRAMLKDNGPPPAGKWADLAVLEPVRDYKARHTSTMLVFEAVGRALDEIAERRSATGAARSA